MFKSSRSPKLASPIHLDDLENRSVPNPTLTSSLATPALDALRGASAIPLDAKTFFSEERNVWRPDTWLLQRCWEALADSGNGVPAMAVADMCKFRQPLAPTQTLYRLAQQSHEQPELDALIERHLQALIQETDQSLPELEKTARIEQKLLIAASAALMDDSALGFACLEELEQIENDWHHIFTHPDQRSILASTITRLGLHPLVGDLIDSAIMRFEDAGAQFLLQITSALTPDVMAGQAPPDAKRLLTRCLNVFRHATLTTLHSRRIAATVFGQAALVDEVLDQLDTIANIQEARRDSGLFQWQRDPAYLRHVKRSSANSDIDFQVYTLQEAVKGMPIRQLTTDQRLRLADRLIKLAVRSDGWTAAGTTTTLIRLEALQYAVRLVDQIPPDDPTRSEGVISLVRGLLNIQELQTATVQVRKALAWLQPYRGRNAERATIWGLSEVYLEKRQPDLALMLLEKRARTANNGLLERLRNLWRERLDDDQLRDDALRLRALLQISQQPNATANPLPKELAGNLPPLRTLFERLCVGAPKVLEGEALVNFCIEDLLQPLLAARAYKQVWQVMPLMLAALIESSGDKHAVNINKASTLLVPLITQTGLPLNFSDQKQVRQSDSPNQSLTNFILALWQAAISKGIWQTVHSIEGTLPLMLAIEGPDAVVNLARAALKEGDRWVQERVIEDELDPSEDIRLRKR